MGRKLVLVGTKITDTSAPILPEVDSVMPTAGALMYINPAHGYAPWGPGVPTDLAPLPNLAAKQAMAATGLSSSDVEVYWDFVDPAMAVPPRMIFERTSKGGLHWIPSPTYDTAGNYGATISLRSPLNDWFMANKGHSFYVAKWGRITRPVNPLMTTAAYLHSILGSGNSGASLFYRRSGSGNQLVYPSSGQIGTESVNGNASVDSPVFQDGAWSTLSGMTYMFGQPLKFTRSADINGLYAPAMVFYGYYAEDLTISGRTYSQVHEAVKARYTRDVLTVGGRYYGDTYTAPSTLA